MLPIQIEFIPPVFEIRNSLHFVRAYGFSNRRYNSRIQKQNLIDSFGGRVYKVPDAIPGSIRSYGV